MFLCLSNFKDWYLNWFIWDNYLSESSVRSEEQPCVTWHVQTLFPFANCSLISWHFYSNHILTWWKMYSRVLDNLKQAKCCPKVFVSPICGDYAWQICNAESLAILEVLLLLSVELLNFDGNHICIKTNT
jgi:hypothetical protein